MVAIYLKSIHPAFLRYVLTYPEVKKKNPDDRKVSLPFLTFPPGVSHPAFAFNPKTISAVRFRNTYREETISICKERKSFLHPHNNFPDRNRVHSQRCRKKYFQGRSDRCENLVELRGIEPLTSRLPVLRAPNCATAPIGYMSRSAR